MHASSAKAKKKAKEDLIPSVWQHFPAELLEKVLTKSSVSTLKTFCRVCKQWKVLIESVAFALKCDSVESALFAFQCTQDNRYIALPNLATDSWDKHDLEFLLKASFLAADQGLLLYKVENQTKDAWDQAVVLIVQNPVSFKWRRLIVPFKAVGMDVMYAHTSLLGGLQVDPRTGNFKVVVAFIDCHGRGNTSITPRKPFIYESSSNSWTRSVTESPVLRPLLSHPFLAYWLIGASICNAGELYWLVEEHDSSALPTQFKTLIKYIMELDTWDMVTVEWPWEKSGLLEPVGDMFLGCDFKPVKAFAEGGNWFLLSDGVPGSVDILLVGNRGLVMPLPSLQCDVHANVMSMTFGTFPASWRLSRKLDSQLTSR
ncbi:hypothetical protein R1sor_006314 [Riccia sorocarpa]|uniref:F-box domain-containing protein n=1 Tax=Riccia sorocarpa TaxID=122646 RepID=A0ABD3HMK6_9MARC